MARLVRWGLRAGAGLARVEYVADGVRDAAEAQVESALRAQGVAFQRLRLAPGRMVDVLRDLRLRLPVIPAGVVVSLTGWPLAQLPDYALQEDLAILNANRESLTLLPLRQIWWLPRAFALLMRREAHDLDSWFLTRLALDEIPPATVGMSLEPAPVPQSAAERPGRLLAPRPDAARLRAREMLSRFERAAGTAGELDALVDLAVRGVDALLGAELGAEVPGLLERYQVALVNNNSPHGAGFAAALAAGLARHAGELEQLGDPETALAVASEVVGLRRRVAELTEESGRTEARRALAVALADAARRARELGYLTKALDWSVEHVAVCEVLEAVDPARFREALATAFNELSVHAGAQGEHDHAVAAAARAVALFERLAGGAAGGFSSELAASLVNLATQQAKLGQHEAALKSITRAIALYEDLAARDPSTFLADLALSVSNLVNVQSALGWPAAAVASGVRAVALYEAQATANPRAVLPELARSLTNLASAQAKLGQPEAALASITRAVALFEDLAAVNPGGFLPSVAAALNNLAGVQSALGQREAALVSITRAVAIREKLAAANPSAFLASLAGSLSNLAEVQASLGQPTHAATRQRRTEVEARLVALRQHGEGSVPAAAPLPPTDVGDASA